MFSGHRHSLIFLLLLALLSACTHLPKPELPASDLWEAQRAKLASVQHWRLRARIGIVTEEGQSGSADLRWEQQGETFSLKVTGAFGRGLLAIEGSEQAVSMQTGKGETLRAANAEDLILQQTGWLIPVSGLRHWILGLPSDIYGNEKYTLDDMGHLQALAGGGWQIEYRRYGAYDGYQLPDRLHMENERVKLKLAVIDWEILGNDR
jgi:outer membrane lipoprotein LolB